ncbi:MAG: RagB/SusD family nutrient uptake outer membrane protein, partial [Bacteroidota bacterium]
MKKNNSFNILMIATTVFFSASCNKHFLDETNTTARTTAFFSTDAGIQQLATGAYYQVFAVPPNGEWYYAATNYGTDEFHVGGDPSNAPWNNYDATFNSVNQGSNTNIALANFQWDALYIGIGDANLLIDNCIKSTSASPAVKNTSLGEGYFMRAYNYLRLVSQYGAVPLQITPIKTVITEFTRAAPKDVYAQIIADLKAAIPLLPTSGGPSHITQDAASHYLAKAYLSRASEINSSWNADTKAADLAAIGPLCDGVITRHPLAANFAGIFNFTGINSANESLPEVILSAQFTNDLNSNSGNGNTQHLYFVSRY